MITYLDGKEAYHRRGVPRLTLMANEARDFVRYIKRPQESAHELGAAQQLSLDVLETLTEMRRQASRFPGIKGSSPGGHLISGPGILPKKSSEEEFAGIPLFSFPGPFSHGCAVLWQPRL